MSDAPVSQQPLVTEIKATAHLMMLEPGVYCVSHSPGSQPPDPTTGLPGARISVPPGRSGHGVSITGFREDGWLGSLDSAALIRVSDGPAQVLMTIYQTPNSKHEAPRIQVTRLASLGPAAQAAAEQPLPEPSKAMSNPTAEAAAEAEVAAHVQKRGDVLGMIGEWIGEPGSRLWIEGFAVSPREVPMASEDIEYQAVLGRGWLSPWAEGGQYCGSRGMALPILGLRARLRGKAAELYRIQVTATFTDGTKIGPLGAGEACEAPSLAPLEAFRVELVAIEQAAGRAEPKRRTLAPVPPLKPVATPLRRSAAKPTAGKAKATATASQAKAAAPIPAKKSPSKAAKAQPTAVTPAAGSTRGRGRK